jgi:MATE family multidrug resistance protein
MDLAVPALAGLAAGPLVSLVDTAFVGQLGDAQLGALGVNGSLFSMTFVIFNFIAYGTTPRVGQAVGREDRAEASDVVNQAVCLALIAGVGAVVMLQAAAGPLLTLMGATGELRQPAETYLRIRAFAGPAVLLINAGRGAFRGYQDTRTPMAVSIGLNLLNLILDPILIFGFGWGLAGAAIATTFAQWSGALAFLTLLYGTRSDDLGIEPRVPSLQELVPFLRIGQDMLIRTASLVGTMTAATAVAARIGVTEVAAHQVANQLWMFLALVVDALAVAAQATVSERLGRGDSDAARRVGNRLLQWGLMVGLLLAVVFWSLQHTLPALFSDSVEVRSAVTSLIVFVALLQPLNGLVFVGDGIFMGSEDFRYLARAMALSAILGLGGLAATHVFEWGLAGVWWSITALMVARLITLAIPYLRSWPSVGSSTERENTV